MEQKKSAKERILETASDLFYREGIRAVGIDRIIAESDVAKASFYRNFPSKDDLIIAYMEYRHSRRLAVFEEARRLFPHDGVKQLYYLVEELIDRLKGSDFRGCPFMNTLVEFPEPGHPAHTKAEEIHRQLWNEVAIVAREAGAADPVGLSEQLRLLKSGAAMVAYIDRDSFQPEHLSKATRVLIEAQLRR
jgi:AcrR family transcriptional regulator